MPDGNDIGERAGQIGDGGRILDDEDGGRAGDTTAVVGDNDRVASGVAFGQGSQSEGPAGGGGDGGTILVPLVREVGAGGRHAKGV